MRTTFLCLAGGMLLLTACDKKKSPTEYTPPTGSIAAPKPASGSLATTSPAVADTIPRG